MASTAAEAAAVPQRRRGRLRRSDSGEPGLRRLRRGRGFTYVTPTGETVGDPEILGRVHELAIPPAWKDVWICSDPLGHLQATGIDAAGRKQYLYHTRWREHRDRLKFRRTTDFARALPRLRRRLRRDLEVPEPTHERVLALAVRLLDVGLFRIGSEEYAEEDHGVGLATVRREHVTLRDGTVLFDYPAKAGVRRIQHITDPASSRLVAALKRRRGGPEELLAYRQGNQWLPLRSDEINDYLKRQIGSEFSAKDFRTWNATVLAAVSVATRDGGKPTKTGRERTIKAAVKDVASLLGNTPAVARRAYIDPRVFDRYRAGVTIAADVDLTRLDAAPDERARARIERAVLRLLED